MSMGYELRVESSWTDSQDVFEGDFPPAYFTFECSAEILSCEVVDADGHCELLNNGNAEATIVGPGDVVITVAPDFVETGEDPVPVAPVCRVTELMKDSYVEQDVQCQEFLTLTETPTVCPVENHVFASGVPAMDTAGIAVMIALVVAIGVGFRRFMG